MYTNPQSGQATASTVAPTLHHGTYRRAIMAVLSADQFTPAERLRANHSVYECEDGAKLALWLKNVRRVAAEREQQAKQQAITNLAQGIARFEATLRSTPHAAPAAATPAQCDELHQLSRHPGLSVVEKAEVLALLPTITQPRATALIGQLWARALGRKEDRSFFSAA